MKNKLNIVIIGSSRGIGFHVAKHLALLGHGLLCISRNGAALDHLEQECRRLVPDAELTTHAADISLLLSNDLDLAGIVSSVFPRVDAVLYNAGLLVNKSFAELNNQDMEEVFRVNFFSAAAAIRELLPFMGGADISHIVTIGSMGGFQGSSKFPGLSLYSASKAALASLSECLAEEFKDRGIKVNCLALGAAQTEMLEEAFPGYKAPLSAEEIATFIGDFLVSGHKYINGKVIPVSLSTP